MPATRCTSTRPPGHGRRPLALVLAVAALLVACQGDFERPTLDNPADPANGNLPPTPVLQVHARTNRDSTRFWMTLVIDVSSEVGIAEYQIFKSDSEAIDPGELILHVPTGLDSVLDEDGIAACSSYHYRVRSIGTDGMVGLRSERASVTAVCPDSLPQLPLDTR